MAKELRITISFDDKQDYEFVKNKPNSSYYIRKIVKNDRLKIQSDDISLENKIKELKEYIDMKLQNSNIKNNIITEEFKDEIKNALMAFD